MDSMNKVKYTEPLELYMELEALNQWALVRFQSIKGNNIAGKKQIRKIVKFLSIAPVNESVVSVPLNPLCIYMLLISFSFPDFGSLRQP